MKCPNCGDKTKIYIKTKDFEIEKCKLCGLGITKNLKAHLGDYHRDEQYVTEERLFKNIFQKRAKLISKFIRKGSILEVGCSTGLLLSLLKKKGLDVTGVEVSKPAAKVAKEEGIKIFITPFEKFNTKKKYDCIIFNQTLEHLDNPFLALKKSSEILSKKGILFIDLPNFDALTLKILKGSWPHLLPEEHLWHFTYKSLEILLKRNNLEIFLSEKSSGIWDLDSPLDELLASLFSFKKRFFINFISAIPSLIISKMKLGSGLMVIAKKI